MAKPRIFVSSTYYDLKHIRASLEAFIHSFGYEPVLFESGDIGFSHDKPLDESCYNEIKNCHMQVLIIGGSYGSPESGTILSEKEKKDQYFKFNSITKKEFEVANKRNIPIYFFVESGVLAEYSTYKKNRDNQKVIYAHVSSVNIFHLLDDIYALHSGNYIKPFTKAEDISDWLKLQWAHLMSEFISNRTEQIELTKIKNSVDELNNVTNSLKAYTEAFLNNSNPAEFAKVKTEEESNLALRMKKRFFDSPLIEYITRNEIIDEEKLFKDFMISNSLDQFCEMTSKYDVSETQRGRITAIMNDPAAINDYEYLKDYMKRKIDFDEYTESISTGRKNFLRGKIIKRSQSDDPDSNK